MVPGRNDRTLDAAYRTWSGSLSIGGREEFTERKRHRMGHRYPPSQAFSGMKDAVWWCASGAEAGWRRVLFQPIISHPAYDSRNPHTTQNINRSMIPQPRRVIIKTSTATGQDIMMVQVPHARDKTRGCFPRLHGDLSTECCLHTGGSRERPYLATNARKMTRVTG